MTRDEFWSIVEQSREGWDAKHPEGNMDRQLAKLKELLLQRPTSEVASYAHHAGELFDNAYRWDLWDAAFLIGQGCSDDGFMDFRGWLISMGRSNYERALADVESLADIAKIPGVEDIFFEEFMSVPAEVYEMQTNEAFDWDTSGPDKPAGRRTPEAEFPTRFPKLWQRFRAR